MHLLRFIPSAIALSLAGSVCIGSMYVTLTAAAVQQDGDFAVAPPVQPGTPANIASTVSEPATPTVAVDSAVAAATPSDVVLGDNGTISGTLGLVAGADGVLTPAAGLNVHFIRDGQIAASAVSNADGAFSVSGLEPGIYGVIGSGDEGFCAFGIRAVDEGAAGTPMDILTAVIPPKDFDLTKQLINSSLPAPPSADPVVTESITADRVEPSTAVQHHQLYLNPDGSLTGTLLLPKADGSMSPVSDFTLSFVMGDSLVATASPASDGSFTVRGLTPGAYSVVGIGQDGTLAIGIDVLGAFSVALQPGDFQPTNVLQGTSLAASPVGAGNFNSDNAADASDGFADGGAPGGPGGEATPPGEEPVPGADTPGGAAGGTPGGGGGSTAGGGGAGGGGGDGVLGALLGGAAGAAIGYALSDDDNNNNNNAAGSPSL
jgi:hypothetical protein